MYRSFFRLVRESCRICRSLFGFYRDLQTESQNFGEFEFVKNRAAELDYGAFIFSAIDRLLLKAGRVVKLDGVYLAQSGAISSLKGRLIAAARSIRCGDHTVVVEYFVVI
jgi:hypothetical protein